MTVCWSQKEKIITATGTYFKDKSFYNHGIFLVNLEIEQSVTCYNVMLVFRTIFIEKARFTLNVFVNNHLGTNKKP